MEDSPPSQIVPKRLPRRLVVCMDGTWNTEGDCTNIFHLSNLVQRGECADGWHQMVKYEIGVGTGLLDGISGGAFGSGLSDNVRAAYQWLIECYEEGDEIYVFGFSRGAFSARSLVGFLDTCGLLRTGAPLPVTELWSGYRTARIPDPVKTPDPESTPEDKTLGVLQLLKTLAPSQRMFRPLGALPENADDCNATERLLKQWSRRVKVRCIGIFDTVGSMGLDALSIPGVHDFMSAYHNLELAPIIEHGFHALAIDEHRSNFSLTPWRKLIAHITLNSEGGKADNPNVKQRWFAGSHSNIGGGYEDNLLALIPLQWMITSVQSIAGDDGQGSTLKFDDQRLNELSELAGTKDELMAKIYKGLKGEPKPRSVVELPGSPFLRDSFEEFGGIYTQLFRAKRNRRRIDPPDVIRRGVTVDEMPEDIDPSVPLLTANVEDYRPLNLIEYANREEHKKNDQWKDLRGAPPKHRWLNRSITNAFVLLVWSTLAGIGWLAFVRIFGLEATAEELVRPMMVLAFIAALSDLGESRMAHETVLHPEHSMGTALTDSLFWGRAAAVLLAILGAGFVVTARLIPGIWDWAKLSVHGTHPTWKFVLPLVATALAASFAPRKGGVKWGVTAFLLALSYVVVPQDALIRAGKIASAALAAIVFGWWVSPRVGRVVARRMTLYFMFGFVLAIAILVACLGANSLKVEALGGLAMMTAWAFFYNLDTATWQAQPLFAAGLGSVVALQKCRTPGQVMECFETWVKWLTPPCFRSDTSSSGSPAAKAQEAARRTMAQALRQSLWRDTIAFVPIYCILMGLGIRLLCLCFGWKPWFLPWVSIPVLVALMDWLENSVQFRYLRHFENNTQPKGSVVSVMFVCTWIKNGAAVLGAVVVPLLALLLTAWNLSGWPALGLNFARQQGLQDWRATTAMVIVLCGLQAAVIWLLKKAVQWGKSIVA